MQVVGQDANGDGLEGKAILSRLVGAAQAIDFPHQQIAGAVGECEREEECATLDLGAAIA